MNEQFAERVLGPLLLLQGLYTRWVTPRLPEASGERQGQAGSGSPLRLLIGGDSAAAGVGAQTQDEALCGRLVAQLAGDYQVDWTLWAQSGLNSLALLTLLEAQDAQPFDVALLSIGVNDVTSRIRLEPWLMLQERLLQLLRDKFGVNQIIVSPLPPMHLFPALPRPLRGYLGSRSRRFNQQLATLVEQTAGCTLLDINLSPAAGQMARDGFHPGPMIYRQWAEHAARTIIQSSPIEFERKTAGATQRADD